MQRGETLPADPEAEGGTYCLLLQTDSFNEQIEGQVDNNVLSSAIELAELPRPDLTVTSVTVPSDPVQFGDTIEVVWTVENVGVGPAPLTWHDRIWFSSGDQVGSDAVELATVDVSELSPLEPGESYTFAATITLPVDPALEAGTYFLLVETDVLKEQFESRLDNSLMSCPVGGCRKGRRSASAPLRLIRTTRCSSPKTVCPTGR